MTEKKVDFTNGGSQPVTRREFDGTITALKDAFCNMKDELKEDIQRIEHNIEKLFNRVDRMLEGQTKVAVNLKAAENKNLWKLVFKIVGFTSALGLLIANLLKDVIVKGQ